MEDIKKAVPQDVDTTNKPTSIVTDDIANLQLIKLNIETAIMDKVMKLNGKSIGNAEGYLRGLAIARKTVMERIKFLQAIAK